MLDTRFVGVQSMDFLFFLFRQGQEAAQTLLFRRRQPPIFWFQMNPIIDGCQRCDQPLYRAALSYRQTSVCSQLSLASRIMSGVLSAARYGKTLVRVLRVVREGNWHNIVEYNVEVLLEGDITTRFVKVHLKSQEVLKSLVAIQRQTIPLLSLPTRVSSSCREFVGPLNSCSFH